MRTKLGTGRENVSYISENVLYIFEQQKKKQKQKPKKKISVLVEQNLNRSSRLYIL